MYPNGRIRILPDYLFGPRLFILGDGCQAGGEGEETRTLRNNDPCCCTTLSLEFLARRRRRVELAGKAPPLAAVPRDSSVPTEEE